MNLRRKKARRVLLNHRKKLLKFDFENEECGFEENALAYCLLKMRETDVELFEILYFYKIRDNTIGNTSTRFNCSPRLIDTKVAKAYDLLNSIFEDSGYYDI